MEKDELDVKRAVALRYRQDQDHAPKIIAIGRGEIARRIIKEAMERGIPLYEDPELVNLLSKLPLGSEIPPELYRAVAEVLVFIYQLDRKSFQKEKGGE